MIDSRATISASLAFAAIFALVSLVLGFGIILSIVSALIGAISGSTFIDRSSRHLDLRSREIEEQMFRGELRDGVSQKKLLQDRKGLAKLLLFISIIFSFQSPLQRVASYTFLVQLLIGAVAVSLFCFMQAVGIEVDLVDNPSLVRLFANAFPMEGASAAARTRFDDLFVPLASLFAFSLAMFGAAYLASIPAALKDVRRHAPAMFLAPVLVFSLWLLLFSAGSSPSDLQRLIIGGHVWVTSSSSFLHRSCTLFLPAHCRIRLRGRSQSWEPQLAKAEDVRTIADVSGAMFVHGTKPTC
jgi:hypothetical protein